MHRRTHLPLYHVHIDIQGIDFVLEYHPVQNRKFGLNWIVTVQNRKF